MKKCLSIVFTIILMTGFSFGKKSKMDPLLQEKISQDLGEKRFGAIIDDGINASPGAYCWFVVKNAGESEVLWDQCPGARYCHKTLDKGTIVVVEEVKLKKWGFRIHFRTADKYKYQTTKTYTETIKDTESDKEVEIEKEKDVTVEAPFLFKIDFKFNEQFHANTPENEKRILDTLGQGFVFFKTKEDALVFVDSEISSDNSVEIGMTVDQVVKILGIPKKKMKAGNKMVYKYDEWVIKFTDEKVSEVEF